MIYALEAVAESLKNEKYSDPIFEDLGLGEEVELNDSFIEEITGYECRIIIIGEDDYSRTVKIVLKQKNSEVNTKDVEIQAFYPKK